MRLPLDHTSQVSIFRQIAQLLRREMGTGALPVGTRLPSSRSLAAQLGVSRITVTNAYLLLEADGLIVAREGSGTYVCGPVRRAADTARARSVELPQWQRTLTVPSTEPPRAIATIAPPDFVGFSGVGDPRLFPITEFARTLKEVLADDGVSALGYGDDGLGNSALRETVTQILASQAIHAEPANVLITSGSQQGLALACQVLLRPGDVVLVERPTYDRALELFRAVGAETMTAPTDSGGLQVDAIEPLLQQHHPRLIYTIPNFQNPTGACMDSTRRRLLLQLADRYNVPIVEDDFVGDLRYDGRAQPAIKALDEGGHVVYLGTFSKMLMPGIRLGYVLCDGPVLQAMTARKRVLDVTTSPLLQRALDRYVTVGRYQAHLRRTTRLYRARRDALVTELATVLPQVHLDPPRGGLFAWLQLPSSTSASELLSTAELAGVSFAPGTRFYPSPADGEAHIRLNFAAHTAEEIALGVQRLAAALKRVGSN